MLHGEPPYSADNLDEVRKKLRIPFKYKKSMSPKCLNFLKLILQPISSKRMNID
jgi:hypothetical protein